MMMLRLTLVLSGCLAMAAVSAYESGIGEWRRAREAALKAPGGWLAVAGLFWLHEGANRFGTGATNDIVLPDGPAQAGVFDFHGGKVSLTMGDVHREIAHDSADAVQVGRLTLLVIRRGDRFAIRLKDPESETRRNFHGLEYFPVAERYRVTARFVAEHRKIPILNVLGQTEDEDCPGYAVFQLDGHELRLYPVLEEPNAKELFFIFRDQTAGKETYGAGRFLYSELPKDGQLILDFNKAYNPPCAFTAYATCPLPPKDNRLPVRIEAGEKKYGH